MDNESFIDPNEPIRDQLDWQGDDDGQEALAEAFHWITRYNSDRRRYHDDAGYFAEYVGSEKCRALGHAPEDDEQLYADGDHGPSWDGEPICLGTRYGVACTYCEGDCDHNMIGPDLWELVTA